MNCTPIRNGDNNELSQKVKGGLKLIVNLKDKKLYPQAY